jgi:hypothetical protein
MDNEIDEIPSARLCLNVHDIRPFTNREAYFVGSVPIALNTGVGVIELGVTKCTWRVSLKELLGNLFKPGGLYRLDLVQFMTIPLLLGAVSAGFPNFIGNTNNPARQSFTLSMAGLEWHKSSFHIVDKSEIDRAEVCTFYILEDADGDGNFENRDIAGVPHNYQPNPLYFWANHDYVNLVLYVAPQNRDRVLDMSDSALLVFNTSMPGYRTVFHITPVSEHSV